MARVVRLKGHKSVIYPFEDGHSPVAGSKSEAVLRLSPEELLVNAPRFKQVFELVKAGKRPELEGLTRHLATLKL